MSMSIQPTVSFEFISGDRPAVRSLELAEHFGLKHSHVLRDIKLLMTKVPESFNGTNFGSVTYRDEKGEERPCYLLTRDAFTLLVMGWSSPRAMEWKLRYIEAFNSLERAALENARADALAQGARAAVLAFSPAQRESLDRVLHYRGKGLSARDIGKLIGRSTDHVCQVLRRAVEVGILDAEQLQPVDAVPSRRDKTGASRTGERQPYQGSLIGLGA